MIFVLCSWTQTTLIKPAGSSLLMKRSACKRRADRKQIEINSQHALPHPSRHAMVAIPLSVDWGPPHAVDWNLFVDWDVDWALYLRRLGCLAQRFVAGRDEAWPSRAKHSKAQQGIATRSCQRNIDFSVGTSSPSSSSSSILVLALFLVVLYAA